MSVLNDKFEQFKAKFAAYNMLRFDPFVSEMQITLWVEENSGHCVNFYKRKHPPRPNAKAHAVFRTHANQAEFICAKVRERRVTNYVQTHFAYTVNIDGIPMAGPPPPQTG